MLIGLPAPASIFKPFNPTGLNELFPITETKDKEEPIDKNSPSGEIVRSDPSSIQSTYQIRKVSSSLNILGNITPEQLVDRIHNPAVVEKDNNFEKSYKLNLNIDYRAKLVDKRLNPEKSGNGHDIKTVTRKKTVKKYWAGYMVQSHFKDRDRQVDLFYNQTEKTVSRIKTVRVDSYRSVRNKVAARFRYNLNLDLSFLAQFDNQTQQLDERGNTELDGYLSTTDKLLDSSAELTKAFFDTVDGYLDDTKERLIGRVEEFFEDLRQATGRDINQFEQDKELMIEEINSFFGNVQILLDNTEGEILDRIGGADEPVLEADTASETSSDQMVKNTNEKTTRLTDFRDKTSQKVPETAPDENQEQLIDTVV